MSVDDAFFGRVGHDLRGELATILAGVHFVLRYEAQMQGRARQMLERVEGASQRMRHQLGELGNAAWAVADPLPEPLLAPYNFDTVLDLALERARKRAAQSDVELLTSVSRAPDAASFIGDVELLSSAFDYALGFALARSAGARVVVETQVRPSGIRVTISDSGGSGAEDRVAQLGEPFAEREFLPKQLGAGRERLGLGLAICRGVLRAHGGGLLVEPSLDGRGIVLRCDIARPSAAARVA